MAEKNIKIQVWTDLFYARFIAIWWPQDEPNYVSTGNDAPHLLVLNTMYEGRSEVVGGNPVATTQHPMPPEFLKQQVRHISQMFDSGTGVFQPSSKALAATYLAKMKVGYNLVKEMNVKVGSNSGSNTLKALRDSLAGFSDAELEKIEFRMEAEHPDDAYAKSADKSIHKVGSSLATPQYITVTKLANVYDVADTSIDPTGLARDTAESSYAPGTEKTNIVQSLMGGLSDLFGNSDADSAILSSADKMAMEAKAAMENGSLATDVVTQPTRDQAQQRTIMDLQSKVSEMEAVQSTLAAALPTNSMNKLIAGGSFNGISTDSMSSLVSNSSVGGEETKTIISYVCHGGDAMATTENACVESGGKWVGTKRTIPASLAGLSSMFGGSSDTQQSTSSGSILDSFTNALTGSSDSNTTAGVEVMSYVCHGGDVMATTENACVESGGKWVGTKRTIPASLAGLLGGGSSDTQQSTSSGSILDSFTNALTGSSDSNTTAGVEVMSYVCHGGDAMATTENACVESGGKWVGTKRTMPSNIAGLLGGDSSGGFSMASLKNLMNAASTQDQASSFGIDVSEKLSEVPILTRT